VLGDHLDGRVEDPLMLVTASRLIQLRRFLMTAIVWFGRRRWTLQTEDLSTSSTGLHNLLTNTEVAKMNSGSVRESARVVADQLALAAYAGCTSFDFHGFST
jgi:hypothetical protein